MKRIGNIYPKMISDENIIAAIKEVNSTHRWRKGHVKNKTVAWVEETMQERIIELRTIIENGFEPNNPIPKQVYDTSSEKWRDIHEPRLYPDQYVHHILICAIKPYIMKKMDPWVCGSIPGRGTHYGVKAIKKWMRNPSKTRHCAELDIKQFYHNIQPKVVMDALKRIIKDHRVLDLCERIIKDGIMIGYYTSQWFANLVLCELDEIIRKISDRYIRYMDNITIFMSNKRKLKRLKERIVEWLKEHGLQLKENWQLFNTNYRMPSALGYRFGRGFTIPRKKNLFKLKRQLNRVHKRMRKMGTATYNQACGVLSRLGQLKWCNSANIYKYFVEEGLQRKLKNVVRRKQRKERMRWNTLLVNQQ